MTESPNPASSNQPHPELPTLSTTLLQRVRDMHPEGWSRLVEIFGPIVYRWCRQSGVAEHDAPDIVQEVFASVARGISDFRRQKESGSFRSWLATVTRSRIRDHFRRCQKLPQAAGGTAAMSRWQELEESLDLTVDEATVPSRISRRVLELVQAEFEPRTWSAFWKTTIEDQPVADVAEELRMSTASVYQCKSRVLRKLRQKIAEIPS